MSQLLASPVEYRIFTWVAVASAAPLVPSTNACPSSSKEVLSLQEYLEAFSRVNAVT
jgi:hypothetical protein